MTYNAFGFGHIPKKMMPDATVGGCIDIFENAWTDCDSIIKDVESRCQDPNSGINWSKATTVGKGMFQDARTNYDMSITTSASLGDQFMVGLHNKCNDTLLSAGTSYHSRYGINESFWQEGYNLLKYNTGQEYKVHYDSGTGMGRHLSCILYLNDNYTGGEIEFPLFKVKIKPKAGMLILFPSNFAYKHIAHPVTSGTKYAMVTWLHDRQQ